MKKLSLLLCFLFTITMQYGQQKGVTENGDEVVLYDDGTWKYLNDTPTTTNELLLNPATFERDEKATFLLKSSKMNVGFYLDPKVWNFKKATDNADAEYELQSKDGDLYGMIISEQIEIPLETMRNIALENGRSASPDLKIVKEEYRMVNGLKMLCLQMDGTIQGIKFSYYGYYHSFSGGTVQFILYTAQNLLDKYKPTCEMLLNGMVELE